MLTSCQNQSQNHFTSHACQQSAPTPARMASIMRERAEPGCTRDDLLDAGFTEGEIDRFEITARQLARQKSLRHTERPEMGGKFDPERDHKLVEIAADICAGLMPSESQVVARLRSRGFGNADIARLWPRIVHRLSANMERV